METSTFKYLPVENALIVVTLVLGTGWLDPLSSTHLGSFILWNSIGIGDVTVRFPVTGPGLQDAEAVRTSGYKKLM